MKQSSSTSDSYGGGVTIPLPEPVMRHASSFKTDPQEPLLRVEGLRKEYAGNSKSGRGALRLFDGLIA